jgi:hypothetical protein
MTPDGIEASLVLPDAVIEALLAKKVEQDEGRGDWPSPRAASQPHPPWPDEDSPVLRFLLQKANASIDAGMDVRTAMVQLGVHAWFEGGIENYDRVSGMRVALGRCEIRDGSGSLLECCSDRPVARLRLCRQLPAGPGRAEVVKETAAARQCGSADRAVRVLRARPHLVRRTLRRIGPAMRTRSSGRFVVLQLFGEEVEGRFHRELQCGKHERRVSQAVRDVDAVLAEMSDDRSDGGTMGDWFASFIFVYPEDPALLRPVGTLAAVHDDLRVSRIELVGAAAEDDLVSSHHPHVAHATSRSPGTWARLSRAPVCSAAVSGPWSRRRRMAGPQICSSIVAVGANARVSAIHLARTGARAQRRHWSASGPWIVGRPGPGRLVRPATCLFCVGTRSGRRDR